MPLSLICKSPKCLCRANLFRIQSHPDSGPVGLCYTPNIQIHTPGLNFSCPTCHFAHLLLILSTSALYTPHGWLTTPWVKMQPLESPVCKAFDLRRNLELDAGALQIVSRPQKSCQQIERVHTTFWVSILLQLFLIN